MQASLQIERENIGDDFSFGLLPPTMNSYRMMYNGFVRIWVMFMGRQEDFVLPGR